MDSSSLFIELMYSCGISLDDIMEYDNYKEFNDIIRFIKCTENFYSHKMYLKQFTNDCIVKYKDVIEKICNFIRNRQIRINLDTMPFSISGSSDKIECDFCDKITYEIIKTKLNNNNVIFNTCLNCKYNKFLIFNKCKYCHGDFIIKIPNEFYRTEYCSDCKKLQKAIYEHLINDKNIDNIFKEFKSKFFFWKNIKELNDDDFEIYEKYLKENYNDKSWFGVLNGYELNDYPIILNKKQVNILSKIIYDKDDSTDMYHILFPCAKYFSEYDVKGMDRMRYYKELESKINIFIIWSNIRLSRAPCGVMLGNCSICYEDVSDNKFACCLQCNTFIHLNCYNCIDFNRRQKCIVCNTKFYDSNHIFCNNQKYFDSLNNFEYDMIDKFRFKI